MRAFGGTHEANQESPCSRNQHESRGEHRLHHLRLYHQRVQCILGFARIANGGKSCLRGSHIALADDFPELFAARLIGSKFSSFDGLENFGLRSTNGLEPITIPHQHFHHSKEAGALNREFPASTSSMPEPGPSACDSHRNLHRRMPGHWQGQRRQ